MNPPPPPPVPPPGGYHWPGKPVDIYACGAERGVWRDPQREAVAALEQRLMAAHIARMHQFLVRWSGGAGA